MRELFPGFEREGHALDRLDELALALRRLNDDDLTAADSGKAEVVRFRIE